MGLVDLVSFGTNKEVKKELAKSNKDVNTPDDAGRVPLVVAAENGNLEVVQLLLEAGADADVRGTGKASIMVSCLNRGVDPHVSAALLAAGASPKGALKAALLHPLLLRFDSWSKIITDLSLIDRESVDGATAKISPLVPSDVIRAIVPEDTHFWLAANNDAPMLAAELTGGLDPNMKTENGMTLLHWACAGDAPECVQLLLDAGADKEAGDPTPIFYCMHESSGCLENMLSAGADANDDFEAYEPIHFALAANSPACVTALVGAGAWVTRKEMVDDYEKRHAEEEAEGEEEEEYSEDEELQYYQPLHLALEMSPPPTAALKKMLELAPETIRSEPIGFLHPIFFAAKHTTTEAFAELVKNGFNIMETYQGDSLVPFVFDLANEAKKGHYSSLVRLKQMLDYLISLPAFKDKNVQKSAVKKVFSYSS